MLRRTVLGVALLATGLQTGCGPGGQTITGKVVTQDGGSAAGLTVAILSAGTLQKVATNPDGSFRVSGILPPYDLMVADPALRSVNVFQGLFGSHATLTPPQYPPTNLTVYQATLNGSVTTGPSPEGLEELNFAFDTPDTPSVPLTEYAILRAPSVTFETPLFWVGPTRVTGDLYVLSSYLVFSGPPPPAPAVTTVWNGFAVLPDVTLSAAATVTIDAGLQPIGSTTVSGTLVSPPGFGAIAFYEGVYARPDGGRAFAVPASNKEFSSATNFAFDLPVIPGIRLQLQAGGFTDAGTQFLVAQTLDFLDGGININLPVPAKLEAPTDQTTVKRASAVFRWTPVAGATVYVLSVMGFGGGPTVTLYTNGTAATLPDVSRLGLPPVVTAGWSVSSYTAPVAVDQLVGDAGVGVLTQGDFLQTTSSYAEVGFL